jgi:hypothetical protein
MAQKTTLQKVGTTVADIVANPLESGIVLRISSLFISNTTDSNVEVDVEISRDGSSYNILKGGVIPSGKTLNTFVNKEVGVYLEEGDALGLKASAADSLDAVCSYTEVDPTAVCEPICME